MGIGIPLPALQIQKQEDPLDQLGKAMQLKSLLQGQQMQKIQLQQAQQAQQDQDTIRQIYQQTGGDPDKTIAAAAKAGVSPNTLMALQTHALQVKTQLATLTKDQIANHAQTNDNITGLLQSVANAPPEKKASIYAQARQQVLQHPEQFGITDPSQVPPEQYPGDEAIQDQLVMHQGGKLQFDQEMKRREVAAQETQAAARMTAANATAGKQGPLVPPQVFNLNKTLQNRFQVLHPNQPLPPEYQLQTGATQKDYDTIDKALQQVEQAEGVKAQQEQVQATRAQTQANSRSDKSYQFNNAQLEKVAQPVDQAISRLGRLNDALAQNTPQADALVAPELLSVMAGGQGSGLRMNEAEISRIVGGRSKWESLKAAVNQWSLDPSKANSITPDQRQQIRALTAEVDNKLKAKQAAIDEGRQALINTDDPGQHRKIVANVRSKMSAVDQGQAAPAGGMVTMKAPNGQTKQVPADQVEHYKSMGATVVNQ